MKLAKKEKQKNPAILVNVLPPYVACVLKQYVAL